MTDTSKKNSLWRRCLSRLTSTHDDLEAAELQKDVEDQGFDPVGRCHDRERVTLCGTLRTVTLSPRAGSPALEAELYDGSGTVTLVWLGRRRIGGIEPGRNIRVSGRISVSQDRKVIYNPRYELRPATVRR